MSNPTSDEPSMSTGPASELRRSVGQATERIHEIIDAAERVAGEIRNDAEAEAEAYLAERRREADRLAAERTDALDSLTAKVAESAERFKTQADALLAELESAIRDARAGVLGNGVSPAAAPAPFQQAPPRAEAAAPAPPPPPAPVPPPPPTELRRVEPDPEPPPVVEPERVSPGTEPVAAFDDLPDTPERADRTAEALLRATQMAVTGKGRDEIVEALRADFPGVDAAGVADEILS